MPNYRIVQNNGHYDVLLNDEFYCSTDSIEEAVKEIEHLMYAESDLAGV